MTVELAAARQRLDDERTHTQTRLADQRAGYKTDSPNSVPFLWSGLSGSSTSMRRNRCCGRVVSTVSGRFGPLGQRAGY